jgi:hypothetical protein
LALYSSIELLNGGNIVLTSLYLDLHVFVLGIIEVSRKELDQLVKCQILPIKPVHVIDVVLNGNTVVNSLHSNHLFIIVIDILLKLIQVFRRCNLEEFE